MFSEAEIAYLQSQRLARIATVSAEGQPDVAAVSFEFDGQVFYVGGLNQKKTLKYLNVLRGNTKVALVIDDVVGVSPWQPRGLKLHGSAEIVERTGAVSTGAFLKITPEKVWSWGIEKPVFEHGEIFIKKSSKDDPNGALRWKMPGRKTE